jgi:hypothetical protein
MRASHFGNVTIFWFDRSSERNQWPFQIQDPGRIHVALYQLWKKPAVLPPRDFGTPRNVKQYTVSISLVHGLIRIQRNKRGSSVTDSSVSSRRWTCFNTEAEVNGQLLPRKLPDTYSNQVPRISFVQRPIGRALLH